jgi:hypothetical protein
MTNDTEMREINRQFAALHEELMGANAAKISADKIEYETPAFRLKKGGPRLRWATLSRRNWWDLNEALLGGEEDGGLGNYALLFNSKDGVFVLNRAAWAFDDVRQQMPGDKMEQFERLVERRMLEVIDEMLEPNMSGKAIAQMTAGNFIIFEWEMWKVARELDVLLWLPDWWDDRDGLSNPTLALIPWIEAKMPEFERRAKLAAQKAA